MKIRWSCIQSNLKISANDCAPYMAQDDLNRWKIRLSKTSYSSFDLTVRDVIGLKIIWIRLGPNRLKFFKSVLLKKTV